MVEEILTCSKGSFLFFSSFNVWLLTTSENVFESRVVYAQLYNFKFRDGGKDIYINIKLAICGSLLMSKLCCRIFRDFRIQ